MAQAVGKKVGISISFGRRSLGYLGDFGDLGGLGALVGTRVISFLIVVMGCDSQGGLADGQCSAADGPAIVRGDGAQGVG